MENAYPAPLPPAAVKITRSPGGTTYAAGVRLTPGPTAIATEARLPAASLTSMVSPLSVTAAALSSVAEAPLVGAENTTATPGTGLPAESTTSTCKGDANRVDSAALWLLPPAALIVAGGTKVALTTCSPVIVTTQMGAVPDAAHAPPHPANTPPGTALAVRITSVPSMKDALLLAQAVPHAMAPGGDAIVPPAIA